MVQINNKIGSYAEVRKGIHKVLGVTRAIKIISKSEASNEEVTRVLHEAEILKQLVSIVVTLGSSKYSKDTRNILKCFLNIYSN